MYTVYVHKNLKNEKYYVGCTRQNPKARWQNGLGYQKQPKMWSDIQNSDWNKDWVHGILGKFENKKDALNYEAFLIAMLDTIENGYNSSSFNSYNYKRTEEHRKKISEALSGKKNPMFGKHFTEETRKKMAEAHTGKHFTEEHKNKLSEAMTGKHNRPQKSVLQLSINGELIAEYPSSYEAERQTGCNKGHICSCCKGKRKTCGGYIWMYAS